MMIKNFKEEDEKKVIELLASNQPANDLIALEIIKHSQDLKPHLGKLLVILSGAKDDADWVYRYSYVKPFINSQAKEYLEINRRHSRNYKLYPTNFLEYFGRKVGVDMAYIEFHKDPFNAGTFLQLEERKHPKRKEVFQKFLEQNSTEGNVHWIKVNGLYFKELELLLTKLFSISDLNPIPHLSFLSYKSKEVPQLLFTRKYVNVQIEFNYTKPIFPSFIFQLKGVQKLTLPFYNSWKFPTDWSGLDNLREINLFGADKGFVFKNLDFIDALPLLERIQLSLHYLANPIILIRKRLPDMHGFQFKNDLGFPIKLPVNIILQIAEALGNSDLDNQQRKFYFKKFLHLKKLEDAQWFPLDDRKILINVPHLKLQRTLKVRLEQRGIKVIAKEIKIYNEEDENLYRLIYSKNPQNGSVAFEIIMNKENPKRYLPTLLILLAASEKVEDAEYKLKSITPFLTAKQQKYLGSKIQNLKGKHYQPRKLQRYFDRKTSIEYGYINFQRTGILPLVFSLEE
ncbi:MAG: hypothetical protein AB8F94_28585 [Saprospiraceae bacterium]